MTPLSRCYIKAALLYLLLGITLGSGLLLEKSFRFADWLWALRPLHGDWLLIGWFLQCALGVAHWILPRPDLRRSDPTMGWTSFCLLNGALLISTLNLAWALVDQSALRLWPVAVAVGFELAGVILFLCSVWPRISYISPAQR